MNKDHVLKMLITVQTLFHYLAVHITYILLLKFKCFYILILYSLQSLTFLKNVLKNILCNNLTTQVFILINNACISEQCNISEQIMFWLFCYNKTIN